MDSFLIGAAGFILVMVVIGMVRILWGPAAADRLMSAQLLGSGGIAAMLLVSVVIKTSPLVDVALTIGLLAAFASAAFVTAASQPPADAREAAEP